MTKFRPLIFSNTQKNQTKNKIIKENYMLYNTCLLLKNIDWKIVYNDKMNIQNNVHKLENIKKLN